MVPVGKVTSCGLAGSMGIYTITKVAAQRYGSMRGWAVDVGAVG